MQKVRVKELGQIIPLVGYFICGEIITGSLLSILTLIDSETTHLHFDIKFEISI